MQALLVIMVSVVVAVFGLIAVVLPDEDRGAIFVALAMAAVGGGLLVAITDRWISRSLDVLVVSGSELRQSAAERAADLARLNAELRRHDRDRAALFATMSHELRTPLNAIIGQSRLLLDELDGELSDEQRTDVEQIHDGGLGLLRIVNGTLDFARLEAGVTSVERVPVQVWAVAEEVVALLRPLAESKGLELASCVSPSLPPVLADEERLRQVLVNLVGNALKFTEAGSVRVRARVASSSIVIGVEDTGIGIADEMRELVFEPFRQGEQGSARRHDGTGLGLAIARRLVELMGGRIWVESELGSGSTFSILLGQATAIPPLAPASPAQQTPAQRLDVAIVASSPAARQLAVDLTRHGLLARCVQGTAWEPELRTAAPRLVLVDVLRSRAAAWQVLEAMCSGDGVPGARLGLFGIAEENGARLGNVQVVPALTVVPMADLQARLPDMLHEAAADEAHAPVLVVSPDAEWRRRVAMLVQSGGHRVHEAAQGDAALASARRVQVRAVIIDLVVSRPGIVELLAELQAALGRRTCLLIVVTPVGLSPRELRDLHLGALSWVAADAYPLPSLAREIAEQLAAGGPALRSTGGR
jgi:signal transduction histidine kinase